MGFLLGSLTSSWWRRGRLEGPEFGPGAAPVEPAFVDAVGPYRLASIRALGLPGTPWCRESVKSLGGPGAGPVPATVRVIVVVGRGETFPSPPFVLRVWAGETFPEPSVNGQGDLPLLTVSYSVIESPGG